MKERGNKLLRYFDRYVGIFIVFLLGICKRKQKNIQSPKNIGCLLLSAIGDILIASAPILELHTLKPKIKIILFVARNNKMLIPLLGDGFDVVDINVNAPLKTIKLLQKANLDVLVDFSQWARLGAICSFFSGAQYKIGFKTQGQARHYVYNYIINHSDKVHEIENFRNLFGGLFKEQLKLTALPKIYLNDDEMQKIKKLNLKKYVVFHPWPSGINAVLKQWPQENWICLAKKFVDKGFTVVITGALCDKDVTEKMIKESNLPQDKFISMAGKLNLAQTAALIKNSKLLISVNTGIMHLGAALDIPLIALHGPTNPKRWGPLGDKNVVIVPTSGEYGYLNLGFEYPKVPPKSMEKISIEQVLKAVQVFDLF